jgi:glycosyltransferase involved in cell wall biosynthesis/GR25 family glycosyltransferase involved in LPS biosynthesis
MNTVTTNKILYIVPHLSTGGLPQYVYKQIQDFNEEFEIEVVEINNVGGEQFAVQKNKIRNLVPLHTLGNSKDEILSIIEKFSPHIIHFQEIPQFDLSFDILNKIFDNSRNYFIVVTTHGSYTDPTQIKYHPDRYVLVSEWSRRKFEVTGVDTQIWEYPIEDYVFDKSEARQKLGFDSDWKHVLNVGLFASGKNQKEIFQLAERLKDYKIKFHFVGNQAGNFEEYWKPLMDTKPDNCIVWGERDDVDDFYQAADLFYFPSTLELNPLSIKEALSYKLPSFFRRLETYLDTYDDNKLVTYIDDNIEYTKKLLLTHFGIEESDTPKITIMHILTDIDTEREVRSMQSLTKLTDYGFDYQFVVSKRYTELPPAENCAYPEIISMEPGGKLTPAHYGCYLGHRKAFEMGLETDSDYLFISECDTILDIPHDEFYNKIKFITEKLKTDKDISIFSLGYHHNDNITEKREEYWISNSMTGAHMYVIPNRMFNRISEIYKNEKWNVADLFLATHLGDDKIAYLLTPTTKQAGGFSILDKVIADDRY